MDFSALSSFIEEDNGSGGYEDLLGFSEGGPVGEDMEDDEQPSVQYFAEGGEVEEASAILQRMPKPGRAAQMLQSFAEGGEVQKTPFPELLDISKQVNAAGAPVEKLATPTTAPASTPVSSQINIPTFQPAAPVPTGPNIITPTPAPLAGLGAPPSLTQPTTAPTTTARSLFEQINPATMAAMPTYTTPSFTPTVQTFNRPTLLTQEELQKAQPPLVRYEPSATYGGLQTYQGPLQTSPYADIPNAPTGGTVAPPPPPAPPPNVTPGGYTFATYTTLTPEQLAGVGDKAQVTEAYKGIVTRQQADATAVRNEYNKALAEGNMAMVEQLKPLLVEQEAEFARAKADQAFVNKYFTGVGGAFETPEQYRQRMQDAQFKAQTITELTGATDIAGLGVPVGTKADPYTTAVTQQTKEYNAALNTYNQLKAVYGDTDFVKNYFSEIVAPQKADVDALTVGTQATALKTGATAAFNAITAGQAYKVAAPTLAEFRNEQQTITAFAPAIKAYETNISTLTKARDAAANTGLTGYASRLDELLQSETDKYTQTLGQRQSAIDAAQPDPMRDYILGKQMVAQKIDGFVPVDVGGIDFSKMNAALFDPEIARQNKDLTAATNTYNQLVTLYGNKSDIAVNFFNDVLTPQKNEVAQATALKTAAAAAIGSFNAGKAFAKYTRPAITVNKSTTDAAINKTFDPLIATYNKNIATLDAAKTRAQQAGLDQYTPYFDSLIENEYVKISQADQDRSNYIDAIPRAMGSPPEGEVADTRSRALLKKLSGGSEANTVPLQKFNKGGAVNRAQGSPIYGEIPDSGPITADTRAAFKAKGPSASSVVSDAAKLLRNITGEGVSNLESAVRGSIAAIPGSVGDIESIFRESDKTRRFATTEEVLRDYMPKRATKPTKEAKGFEEVGSYLPLPVPAGTVSKAATTTGKGVEKGAAKMLERLGPRTGRRWESLLAQAGAAPMYAVKPKGGMFYPEGIESGVETYLERVVKGLTGAENLAGRDAKAVADFIRTKGRKYLTSTYGTADDPLRLAISEGRIPLYGSDQERFRDYLLDAARAGNPNAVKDLERFYDDATQLGVQGYVPAGSADPSYVVGNRMQAAQRERLLAEGVPEDLVNPVYPSTSSAEQMASASYSSEARQKLGQLLQGMEALPPDMQELYMRGVGDTDKGMQSLLYSAIKEQPIYDVTNTPSIDFLRPGNLAEGIASIPLSDLERMTFPEAVVKGSQNMRLKRDRGLVLEKARDGKTVPKEIYFEGTQPVYEIDKNQKWVRIMSPDAVELEGAAMRHSIGGYKTSNSYNLGGRPAFESGLARIFSLRNEKGVPQVTVETKFTDEDGLVIKEVRSKFNSEPTAEEKRAVLQLFETLGPKEIKSTSYRNSRSGEALKEEDQVTVNWGDEFKNYMQYKNKGEE